MKLEFWLPAKPFKITQAWGIKNPSYEQFGFSRHNGTDFTRGKQEKTFDLHWPVANCRVYDTEYGHGTGWRIKANTLDRYIFPDGKSAYVNIIIMHLDHKSPVQVGTILNVGDYAGLADNTGFSTGPHCHVMARRIDASGNLIDKNDADNTFDLMAYSNGFYAVDKSVVISTLSQLLEVLKKLYAAKTGALSAPPLDTL